MQPSDVSVAKADAIFEPGNAPGNRQNCKQLRDEHYTRKEDFLVATKVSKLSSTGPKELEATLTAAREALRHCRNARTHLRNGASENSQMREQWNDVHNRLSFLRDLKKSLMDMQRLQSVAKAIVDAGAKGDHALVSKSCQLFESLNDAGPHRMVDTYDCLRSVSENVSHAAVSSMRMLRTNLRHACLGFDEGGYARCMHEFIQLGAISHFASHVVQVFDDEIERISVSASEMDEFSKASDRGHQIMDSLTAVIAKLNCIFLFHISKVGVGNENEEEQKLRRSVALNFQQHVIFFANAAKLVERVFGEMMFSLIAEPTTSLINLFDASRTLCELVLTACNRLLRADGDDSSFRSKSRTLLKDVATCKATNNVQLRRGHTMRNIVIGAKQRSLPSKRELRCQIYEFDRIVSKSMKDLALACLSSNHIRHAEELRVITRAPECWERIRLSEVALRGLLHNALQGVNGMIKKTKERQAFSIADDDEISPSTQGAALLEELTADSWTLTTASLSMIRWISEYLTIGVTAPGALPEALSSTADIFLMLIHSSIDMKGRAQQGTPESFLKTMEDILLERPTAKTIDDYINPAMKRSFQTFLNRYSSADNSHDHERGQDARWGEKQTLRPPCYSQAAGNLFSNAISSRAALIRQCVAAEGIRTLCDVLEVFCSSIEGLVSKDVKLSSSYEPQKMASLRSAIELGKAVQVAFYDLLSWDIIGGWDAISAVAESCRSFHHTSEESRGTLATKASPFVHEMVERILSSYAEYDLPPNAAERLSMVVCSTAMNVLLEGFSCVRLSSHTAAASQMLIDMRTLDMSLVEITGMHPCPGRYRTEMFMKATFLSGDGLETWIEKHRRRLELSERHVRALYMDVTNDEIPIVDQIITP